MHVGGLRPECSKPDCEPMEYRHARDFELHSEGRSQQFFLWSKGMLGFFFFF